MPNPFQIGERDVLLAVDLQNDFCPGGALAVPGGDEVVDVINRIGRLFEKLILTQDWHPPRHHSFASSHPGKQPFDTVKLSYGEQVLWPDHCVQGTSGAALHPDLAVPHAQLILRKGYHRTIDSFSAFFENDRTTPTGLTGYLRERGLSRVFVAGLALDFCVRHSAEDACRNGFEIVVIEDACRAIDTTGSLEEARKSLASLDVPFIDSSALSVA
jgi:nicotinamidase/pyrazinamidase